LFLKIRGSPVALAQQVKHAQSRGIRNSFADPRLPFEHFGLERVSVFIYFLRQGDWSENPTNDSSTGRSHACVISQMTNSGRTSKSRDLNDALPVSLTLFGRISSCEGLPLATSHGVWHADVYRIVETVNGKWRERCAGSHETL